MTLDCTVAITGMNAKPDNPGPGLAVARCLREAAEFKGRIIGFGYDALDPGLYLNAYCDAGYLLPYPSSGDELFIETLKKIQDEKKIDVLIPCLDAELPGMIRLQPLLDELGIKVFLPTQEQLRFRNKDRLTELAKHAGLECPETKSLTNSGFFHDCQDKGWPYPFMVKGLFYDAAAVYNPQHAVDVFRRIAADWGFPVLIQKLVKGEEYNLTAVGDGEGNMLGAVMMKKMAVTDKGKAWCGVSIDDKTLFTASANLIKAINWRGPLEVEVIRDRNGHYQLIEINPRFPAWTYLSAGVGRNLPVALLKLALGQEPPAFPETKSGVMFIRYAHEQIVSIHDFEEVIMNGGHDLTPHIQTNI
ncbi:MAG: ATP-grasp domain-containing protein [Gammaproteobacteria bacterium]|nr:ATP-grasp domain-containing protein [Gammaproteobacteria bacterium]